MPWGRNDLRRSIRRYFEIAFDEPWVLRIERREIRDEERPVAVLDVGPKTVLRARETPGQAGERTGLYPVSLTAYPALPPTDDADIDPEKEAAAEAARVAGLLSDVLELGFPADTEGLGLLNGRSPAAPMRIPLWDYAGVPLTGPDRAGPEDPHDVVVVQRESVNSRPIQDLEDFKRWSVVLDFRVEVEAPGRHPDLEEPLVGSIGPARWSDPPASDPPPDPGGW